MTWMRHDPDDFWQSDQVAGMSIEAAGLLWWLSCRSWKTGPLRDEPELYKRILEGRCKSFDRAWPEARAALQVDEKGLLRAPWIEEEREGAIKRLRSDAERKRQERLRDGNVSIGCWSSNSSVPPYGRTNVRTNERDERTNGRPTGSAGDKPRRLRKPAKPTDPDHAPFVSWFTDAYAKAKGVPYAFAKGKDARHVANVLQKAHGLQEAQRVATLMLTSPPKWLQDGGVDLSVLDLQWNKLQNGKAAQEPARPMYPEM